MRIIELENSICINSQLTLLESNIVNTFIIKFDNLFVNQINNNY